MTESHKKLAREIFLETLDRVSVRRAFDMKLKKRGDLLSFEDECIDLSWFEEIRVVGLGNAAWSMTQCLLDRLSGAPSFGRLPIRGVVASHTAPKESLPGIQAIQSDHPAPDGHGTISPEPMLELCRTSGEKTLLFFLISSGESSIAESPIAPWTLHRAIELDRELIDQNATQEEIATLHKHLSPIEGGRLAQAARHAHKVTFIVSNTPEQQPEATAGGPTVPDLTTIETCRQILEKYELPAGPQFAQLAREIDQGGFLVETAGPDDPAFQHSQVLILLSNKDVVAAAKAAAHQRGFLTIIENGCDRWPLAQAADFLLEALKNKIQSNPPDRPVCLISGGRVLSDVTGNGHGGSNQAFALHCAGRIDGGALTILSAGTSGIDGNSPAAGAIADGQTLDRAQKAKLDPIAYFRESNSHSFFHRLGDTIVTGPLESDMRDLRLILVAGKK